MHTPKVPNGYCPNHSTGVKLPALRLAVTVLAASTCALLYVPAVCVTVKLSPEQQDAVRSQGIAFGIRLNSGEQLWAQQPGQNLRVHDQR